MSLPSSASHVVTFEDTDAVVRYSPYVDGDPLGGWMTLFESNKTEASVSGARRGVGNSVRRAAGSGSSLQFTFYGSFDSPLSLV